MSSDGPSLGRSTAVMAAGTATSRVLGLLRVVVLIAAIGSVTVSANSFAAAYWLPSAIYMLIAGGVLHAVLVPQIIRAEKQPGGKEYVDRLLTVGIVVLALATAALMLAAPLLVALVADSTDPAFRALTIAFTVWSLPQVFFYGVYTLLGQVLNARGVFGPYMWAPAVNNVVAILGILAFIVVYGSYEPGSSVESYAFWTTGPMALLAGTATLGVAAQAFVLLIPLRRIGFTFRPRRGWRGVGLSTAAFVAGWTFASHVVGQIGILVVTRVTTGAAQIAEQQDLGAVAANNQYTIAFTIFMLPHSLVTVSLVTALYTRLAKAAADDDTPRVRRDFSTGLRTVGVFTVFATAVVVVLALPVSRIITISDVPEAAAVLAPVVVALTLGLVALGAWALIQRIYYAYEDAKGLFWLQLPMAGLVALGTLLGRLLAPIDWWTAVAGASIAASYWLGAVTGGRKVRQRLGGVGGDVVRTHVRAALAAVAAAGVGWPLSLLFGDLSRAGLGRAVAACLVVGVVMLAVYVALLRVLRVRELEDLVLPLLRRSATARTMSTTDDGVRTGDGPDAAETSSPGAPDGDGPTGTSAGTSADRHGGGLLESATIGRGTLVAGRYRLEHPDRSDLPGVDLWTGRDQILDRPVRVSLLLEGRITQAQDAARRAALVSDPRLLRVLDVGEHAGVAYVVSELPRGRDLLDLTSHGPLPPDQARAIVGEAAVALEVARRRGVHHLALRPSCVHVTDDGAVLVSGLGMDGELAGLGLGDARSTTRADTVALVALLYLALTGRWPAPTGGDTGDVPPAPVVAGSPVPPADLLPGVPNDLDTLCTVTLGPHDDGPHSPAELVRELEPWAEVDPARVAGVSDDATAWQRHLGTPSASAGAAGVAAAMGAPALDAPAGDPGSDGTGPTGTRTDTSASSAGSDEHPGGDVTGPADSEAEAASATESASGVGATGDTDASAPVARQSVRSTFDDQALPAAARPGTPPPAIPPSHHVPRPDVTPAGRPPVPAGAPRGGVTAPVVGAAGASLFPPVRSGAAPGAVAGGSTTAPRSADRAPVRREEVPVQMAPPDRGGASRMAFDPTPWVLGILLLAVVLGLWTAWRTITSPLPPIGGGQVIDLVETPPEAEGEAPPEDGGASPEETEEEAEPEPLVPPEIVSAQQLDPPPMGDNNEHPEAVDLAIDGDPSTFWFTRWYANPEYGMKPGVGYAVTLAEPTAVAGVTLQTSVNGGMVEVRATDPETPTEGEVLASGPMSAETVLTFEEPVEAAHIVLWFPLLPQDAEGRNRVILNQVSVVGPESP